MSVPRSSGPLHVEATCNGCEWCHESEHRTSTGIGAAAQHAKATGHAVDVVVTRNITFNPAGEPAQSADNAS